MDEKSGALMHISFGGKQIWWVRYCSKKGATGTAKYRKRDVEDAVPYGRGGGESTGRLVYDLRAVPYERGGDFRGLWAGSHKPHCDEQFLQSRP
jgi:hypothetical protein